MRGLIVSFIAAGAAFAALPALAQQGPPLTQVVGTVQSVSGSTLTVLRNGAATPVTLPDSVRISAMKTIDVASIQPGSFIGTTNVTTPDGTGTSTEVHVFPPGLRMGEGNYPMQGQSAGTMMTNGDVTMTVTASKGQEMDIKYNNCTPDGKCTPGGVRHVVIPPGTPVIAITPADKSALTPGTNVMVMASKDASGAMTAAFINVGGSPAK